MIRYPPKSLHHLSEVISGNISDKYRSKLTGLLDQVILADSDPAVRAGGTGGVVNIADFCPTVYGKIVVASWALKRNVTQG